MSWLDRLSDAAFGEEGFIASEESLKAAARLIVPGRLTVEVSDKELEVLALRYREEWTLEKCGKHFGQSRERIRQIQFTALRKLRHPARRDALAGR